MKIRKLDPEVVKRIAAGEVIEEPSSVVRELIENSIDAGATEIEVEIKGGGLGLIRVTDNGCGIAKDDIPLAVQRHTTSKIESAEDLVSISTLGFRGEALYSISSVSKMVIRSRTEDEDVGWEARFDGGELKELKPIPHPVGTTIIVMDLFFNLPVRRRFMGSRMRTARRAIEKVTEYALAHPEVGFKLVVDGREMLNLMPTLDFRERLSQIYGDDFWDDMLVIERNFDRVRIIGGVSRPDRLKESPVLQMFFVNGRRVKENELRAAIYRAYETGLYPQYILFVDVNPRLIDVNIHPQKLEVRFDSSLRMFEKVMKTVKDAIQAHGGISFQQTPQGRPTDTNRKQLPFKIISSSNSQSKFSMPVGEQLQLGEDSAQSDDMKQPNMPVSPEHLFQVHDLYIVAQVPSGILLIDQHAAHERIIYEKLRSRKANTKNLLFPILYTFEPGELKVFEAYRDLLDSFGFKFRDMSGRSIVIEGVPDIYRSFSRDDFREILNSLSIKHHLPERMNELLATMACKAAIKAGKKMSKQEMMQLITDLFACETPFFCPHGRPTMIRFTLEELEKRFGRR